jgi:BirA family biotin operon repressor/biotin-[acetyl-CoA-carboxylase] ligase
MAEPYRINRWRVFTEESVSSTQSWLRGKVAALPDRTVVLAGTQTSGRGRRGNRWESPAGGFYASFLMKPSPPVALAPRVSLLAALVLTRLLKRRGIAALVKWPNDVIAGGKKIAGIVAEAGTFPESWFVLGMGVNLLRTPPVSGRVFLPAGSWSEFSAPPEATELLEQFLLEIDTCWADKDESPISGVLEELNAVLWRKGEQITLSGGNESFTGTVGRISTDGSLVLLADGGERHFNSGELASVPEERR